MFPGRSDRIVLDSNVGDTHLDRDGMRRYALGMEQTFPAFAKWAAARHDSYGLGRTASQVRRSFPGLARRLDEKPVAGFDGSLFRLYAFGGLFKEKRPRESAHHQRGRGRFAAGASGPPSGSVVTLRRAALFRTLLIIRRHEMHLTIPGGPNGRSGRMAGVSVRGSVQASNGMRQARVGRQRSKASGPAPLAGFRPP